MFVSVRRPRRSRRASRPSRKNKPRRRSSSASKDRAKAEQVIRRVLLSPLLAGGDGPYPWFGSVFSGTGMALGVGYLKRLKTPP